MAFKPHKKIEELPQIDYTPAIRDATARREAQGLQVNPTHLFRVTRIIDENTIQIHNGVNVGFLGLRIDKKAETIDYLRSRILGKQVLVKNDQVIANGKISAYVYLKNRLFVNAYLIKSGLGSPDLTVDHKLQKKFIQLQTQRGEIQSNER